MAVLEIQGLGEVEVGDEFLNLSPAEQQSFVAQVYSENVGAAPDEGGFFDRAGDVLESGTRYALSESAKGLATGLDVADLFPETQKDLLDYSTKQSKIASEITGIKPLQEAENLTDVAKSIGEYTLQSAPSTGAAILGGAATGATAGVFAGGPIGGIVGGLIGSIGGFATLYPSALGRRVTEEEQVKGRPLTDAEQKSAMWESIPNAVLDTVLSRLLVAKTPAEMERSLLSSVTRRGVQGAAIELPTELTQETLQILGANDWNTEVLKTPESKYRLTEAALAGGSVGGTLGGLSGAMPRRQPKTTEELAAAVEALSLETPTRLTEAQVVEQLAEENPTLKQVSDEFLSLQQDTGESPTLTSYIDDLNTQIKQLESDKKSLERGVVDTTAVQAVSTNMENSKQGLKDIESALKTLKERRDLTVEDLKLELGQARIDLKDETTEGPKFFGGPDEIRRFMTEKSTRRSEVDDQYQRDRLEILKLRQQYRKQLADSEKQQKQNTKQPEKAPRIPADPDQVAQLDDQIQQLKQLQKAAKDARTLAAQRLNIDANDITLGEMRDNRLVGDLSSRDGLWSGITRYYAQALAPVLPAAAKNQTIRDSVGLLTGTAPAVKARQTPILRTLFNIQSDVGKRLKLPIFSGPVARRTNKILTEIKIKDDSRLGQDINRAKADEVFKKYGVSKRRREDLYDAANRIKKEVYDAGFMEGVKDGVLTEDQYVTGYVSMPKNWLSSERKREKAARAFAKEPDITLKQAQDIVQHMYNKATATNNENFSASDYLSGADFAQGIFTTPGLAKNRTLPKRLNDRLVTEGLTSPDIFRSGMNYVQQVTHAAEMKRRFGDKVDGKNQFKQVIESVVQQNPNDKEIETAGKRLLDLHSSLLGRYNPRDVSPTGRKQISRLLTAEYLATLGLAGITSLVEPLVLFSRVGPGVFIASLTDGLRVMSRKMVRDIFPRFPRSELEKEFESIYYGLPGIIAERYQASAAVDVNNLLTEKFFLANAMTQVTQFGRSVGFFAAKRMVNRNLRILASPDASARSKRTAKTMLSEVGIRNTGKITQEQIDTSLIRFVDQNMMNPDPLNRPLWMNDPSLSWAGQLMTFIRVFANEVLSRAVQNIFRGKTQEGIPLGSAERLKRTFQYVVMATLLTGSTGFVQVFKDSLKGYEDGEVPEPDEPNFWVKAFTTAGLTGPFDQIANAIMAPQYGISPLASFLGPVGADVERVFKAFNRLLTTGDTMGFSREVVRHTPFVSNLTAKRNAAAEALNDLIKRDRSYADQIMIDLIEKMEDEGIDLDIDLDIDF